MTKNNRNHGEDLRGATRLALDATLGVMSLVESMHRTIASGPAILGSPLAVPAKLITGVVYGTIRGVTELVGTGIDVALTELAPLLGEGVAGPEREAVVSALNGVLGDYMVETNNPLAIEMCLRRDGHALELTEGALREAIPDASSRVCVIVHGSSMSDLGWKRNGHDHGAELARDLGVTTVYVRYNSGRHISTNGRELAALADALVAAWPVPVEELSFVAHSMGGLVVRSACHVAELEGRAFRSKVRKAVFLGTPHHGAPLERDGVWLPVLLGVSRYSAPLARLGDIRSAGVTDLRYGNVLDEHWHGRDRFEPGDDPRQELSLPVGVDCYAIAGTLSKQPAEASEAPGASRGRIGEFLRDRLLGDGLVPVDSALGRHPEPRLALDFPASNQLMLWETGHLDLLDRPAVYEALRAWLSPASAA